MLPSTPRSSGAVPEGEETVGLQDVREDPTSKEAQEHLGETDLGTRAARGRWDSRTSGRRRWGRSGDPDGEGTEEGFPDVREEGIGGDGTSKFSRSSHV